MFRIISRIGFLLLLLFISTSYSNTYPLSTHKRWIIDEATGQRTKLACANWAGHLQPMIPEGLDKRPLKEIVGELVELKFNCVRLTYAIYMWTRYGHHNVNATFASLDVPEVVEGIAKNNPSVLSMTHVKVFDTVIHELGVQNVKVLFDNHVSEPKWCCGDDDGNGFFYDRHFNPHEWVHGLTLAAKHFRGNHAVVAMSLRNELRGPRQNLPDWYKYMTQAALAVHKTNPNVLVVISGIGYDSDLHYLKNKPLKINLGKKLVFEIHLYSWSGVGVLKMKDIWTRQPINWICDSVVKGLDYRAGFLTTGKNVAPLIFSEFGIHENGSSVGDNRFLTCLQTYLVGKDLDWGLWAFEGSYYLKSDKVQIGESFGVMDDTWHHLRYPSFTDKFQLLQNKILEPISEAPMVNILYHPLSGQCAQVNNDNDELELGSCETKNRWIYGENGTEILLHGTKKCLTAVGEGLPVIVSDCQSENSSWKSVSSSKLHLATMNQYEEQLCLQKDSNSSTVVTSNCICTEDDADCLDDPQSQWFQLVATNL